MKKNRFPLVFISVLINIIFISILFSFNILGSNNNSLYESNQCSDFVQRIKRLEPPQPENISDPPFFQDSPPSEVVTISNAIETGNEIPFEFVYNTPTWERQAYKKYWHSTFAGGRWSYVPTRIHYALHKLFAYYPTSASTYYDLMHDLGIYEESVEFKTNDKPDFYYINFVAMQSDIQKVISYQNQVIIISKPTRAGLQVIRIPVEKISPLNSTENLLVQLATDEGDELDYSIIPIIKER